MRDPVKILEYEAKRKPVLGDLMLRILTISFDDIDNADLPKNLRTILHEYKIKCDAESSIKELSATMKFVSGTNPDKIGHLKIWVSDDTFVTLDKGEAMVSYMQPLWVEEKGVWLAHVFSTLIDDRISSLKTEKMVTRTEYLVSLAAWRNGLTSPDTPIIDLNPQYTKTN